MCALVKGYTDILTPVNVLPNSDFASRSTLGNTINVTTLDANFVDISKFWQVQSYTGTLSNVTITRQVPNGDTLPRIQITGTIASVGSDNSVAIRVRSTQQPYYRNSTLHWTLGFTPECSTHTFTSASTVAGSAAWIYRNGPVTVMRSSGINTYPYFCIYLQNCNVGDTVNLMFRDAYLYLGDFINPPLKYSLDIQPSQQFLLSDCSNLYLLTNYNPLRTTARINRAGWVRLLKFYAPEATINEYWELLMCKTYNWGKPFMTKIKLWMLLRDQNDQVGIDVEQPYLNGDRTYNYAFQSYRVTKSSTETYVYHFEGQLAAQVNDIFSFRVLLGSVGNYLANDGIRMTSYLPTIPTDNTVNANDTIVTPGSYQVRRFGFNFAS